jgi:hypothetical protein
LQEPGKEGEQYKKEHTFATAGRSELCLRHRSEQKTKGSREEQVSGQNDLQFLDGAGREPALVTTKSGPQ